MKSFIISIILFSVLISGIVANAIYINEESRHLTELAAELGSLEDPTFEVRFNELYEEWTRFRGLADVSCSHSELGKIDLVLEEIKAHAATKSLVDYEAARNALILYLEDIARLEKISLRGLI